LVSCCLSMIAVLITSALKPSFMINSSEYATSPFNCHFTGTSKDWCFVDAAYLEWKVRSEYYLWMLVRLIPSWMALFDARAETIRNLMLHPTLFFSRLFKFVSNSYLGPAIILIIRVQSQPINLNTPGLGMVLHSFSTHLHDCSLRNSTGQIRYNHPCAYLRMTVSPGKCRNHCQSNCHHSQTTLRFGTVNFVVSLGHG